MVVCGGLVGEGGVEDGSHALPARMTDEPEAVSEEAVEEISGVAINRFSVEIGVFEDGTDMGGFCEDSGLESASHDAPLSIQMTYTSPDVPDQMR